MSSVNPVSTKPKLLCTFCATPLGFSSLSANAKRFCSQECMSASIMANETPQIGVRKRPASATVTSSSTESNQRGNEDHEESSNVSSNEDTSAQTPSSSSNNHTDTYKPPKKKKKKGEEDVFEWTDYLSDPNFEAASVLQVKHAPLSRMWENISEGMKLEVENKDVDCRISETAFWVAGVIKIQGFYVLLRYEGFGNDSSGDFWIHLCSESIHHVGWCANKGKPLIPPKSIAKKFSDWRSFLVHRLTGARTLPAHFLTKLEIGLKSVQKETDVLEVVDKNQISQLKVATVTQVVGRRLHVEYWDNSEDGGFWCHEESRLIHPTGWAQTIGHKISQPGHYQPSPLPTTPYDADFESMNLQVGMKLEAIDPLNLSAICSATIKQVLKRGYVMVRIDCYEEDASGFDWFCYHISSNSVFPCGFCLSNGIAVTPPTGWDKATFTWEEYFKTTKVAPAPIKPKEKVLPHGFKVGMKIEAADLMDPRLICVATVSKVVGRLLKIHFDGWEDEYDQWMDARSPDIYPIGWCELVKHRLEPPRPPTPVLKQQPSKKAKKGKKKVMKGKQPNSKPKGETSGTNSNPIKTEASCTITSDPAVASSSKSIFQVTGKPDIKPKAIVASNSGSSFNGNMEKKDMEIIIAGKSGADFTNDKFNTPKQTNEFCDLQTSDPLSWSIVDVAQFLTDHDCTAYCEFFTKNNVDGKKLLSLSKDEIIPLTGMKVGPAVKVFDLISQLKRSTSAAKARSSALSK